MLYAVLANMKDHRSKCLPEMFVNMSTLAGSREWMDCGSWINGSREGGSLISGSLESMDCGSWIID